MIGLRACGHARNHDEGDESDDELPLPHTDIVRRAVLS